MQIYFISWEQFSMQWVEENTNTARHLFGNSHSALPANTFHDSNQLTLPQGEMQVELFVVFYKTKMKYINIFYKVYNINAFSFCA